MADYQVGSPARAAETRVPVALALVIIFTALSCISVALRLYTRKVILRLVAPDDYAIIIAQVLALGVSVVNIISMVLGGVGQHIEFVQERLPVFSKCLFAVIMIYNAAQIITKISLLLQYRRLFPSQNMQLICKWGMVFLGVWGVVQQIYTPFACRPLQDIFPNQKSCIPTTAAFTVNAIMNMLTDFIILLLPVRPVLQLQVNRLRKAYLLLVFCFGIVACGISAVRLHILTLSVPDADVTWDMAITSYLSTIETSIGILCACVPTLRPLIKRISPALVGSSGKDTSAYGNPTKLDTLKTTTTTKHRSTPGTGIYIQKEVDFHSTTELRTNPSSKDPYSIRDRSSEDISIEEIHPMSAAKTRNGPPYH